MLPLLIAAALAFPIPASPPIPVTTPVLGRAPLQQNGLRIASNGSLALAVWNDARTGYTDVLASRVDSDGTPLDATGIVIRNDASVDDVFWNGDAFEVVTSLAGMHSELTFVDKGGSVVKRVGLDDDLTYAARTDEGANTRLLFLPGDGYTPSAMVVDAAGRVIKQGAGGGGARILAAANASGFLVLRNFGSGISERVDRDGNVLSSNDPKLPGNCAADPRFSALTADGCGGFALVTTRQAGTFLCSLDDRGVSTGPAIALQPAFPFFRGITAPVATPTSDGFMASWALSTTQNHAYTYVSRNGGESQLTYDWIGIANGTAADPATNLVLTSYDDFFTATSDDVFVQKGNGPPRPLTFSASLQTKAAIAAGANGFLAGWTENSGTEVRRYVRRFSATGEPQEEPRVLTSETLPFEASRLVQQVLIASSGDTYLVRPFGDRPRRMDARTGAWIDDTPIDLGPRVVVAVGANEHGALAVTSEPCAPGYSPCVAARRIELRGEPLLAPSSPLPGTDYPDLFFVASNGSDYLLAWTNGESICPFDPCLRPPTRVMALRVHGDGTPIDSAALILDAPSGRSPESPSVAWNGTTYLVTWSTGSGDIAAAYVSSDGAVGQLGTIAHAAAAQTIAHAGQFLIFTHLTTTTYPFPDEWRGAILGGQSVSIVIRPNDQFGALAAASNGGYLMLAYDRVVDEAGHVGRVLLDPRVFVTRKRAAR